MIIASVGTIRPASSCALGAPVGRASLTAPMADVKPFRALHYDLDAAGGLQALAAPPYDVIDEE
jgi:hypothetical protein